MSISVESRIHRTLRGVEPFTKYTRWEDLRHLNLPICPFEKGENLLGIYENEAGKSQDLIVFTTRGIYVWDDQSWRSFKYHEVQATVWPEVAKQEARVLTLRLKSGLFEHIPIRRGYLFDVMRFFDRVVEDAQER